MRVAIFGCTIGNKLIIFLALDVKVSCTLYFSRLLTCQNFLLVNLNFWNGSICRWDINAKIMLFSVDCKIYMLTLGMWEMERVWKVWKNTLRGYCTSGPYFWRLCAFSHKIKQLWTKYSMDLVRNVPRNSKITVLLQ